MFWSIQIVQFYEKYTMEKQTDIRIFFWFRGGGREGGITYLFVDLGIQHAKRMCSTMLSSVTCMPLSYFSTLFHKPKDFRERVTEHKMCFVMFSTTLVWNISHSKENSARCYNKCTQVFVQSTRYSWQIWIKIENFRQIFEKNTLIWNFMKTCPAGAESFNADRQTWRS